MATIKQRGKSWVLNWSDATGQHRKSLGQISELEAKTLLQAKEIELKTGKNPLTQINVASIADLFPQDTQWYEVNHPSSMERQRRFKTLLKDPFGHIAVNAITMGMILDYQQQRLRSGKVTPQTINKELGHLNAVLDRAVTQFQTIDSNPMLKLKWKMQVVDADMPRFFSKEELQAIYKADPEWTPIFKFFVLTGVRLKEATQLTLRDLRDGQVRIRSTMSRNQKRNKTAQYRVVPQSEATIDAIEGIKRLTGASKEDDYLMPRLHSRSWSRRVTKAFKRAKVSQDPPTDGVKTFRHTFCSMLAMKDVPLRTIQILAGHTTYRTTEVYASLAPSYLQDSVVRLDIG